MTQATDTHLLLRALVDEFARCGMSDACTSPGSRCTPIVLALAREPRLHAHSHIDERCAGFFALGLAKRTGRPVAITCTSGTAAANLLPAVIEAHEARVPLLLLTADRPPELRDVGAGQTIDQLKLYGSAVRWFVEVGTHDASSEAWIRGLACRAYWTACGPRPGPVHLNLPLREPLLADGPVPEGSGGRGGGQPWLTRRPTPRPHLELGEHVPPGSRAVLVAGRCDIDLALPALAARAAQPLLADPLSRARCGPAAIAAYDALLRDPPGALTPDVVLRFGDLPTSKPLRSWLAALDVPQIAVNAWGQDPAGVVELALEAGSLGAPGQAPEGWLKSWLGAEPQPRFSAAGRLSEPLVARTLGECLPASATLWVGSSMPIRDIEAFWPARADPPLVLSNRGANGIDGTVSSALGAAAARGGPVVMLVGDVALAHDIGGLLAGRRLDLALTIVLIDNGGGGIFDFLPVSGERDVFEHHVATPTGLSFDRAAALFGWRHELIGSAEALQQALLRSLGKGCTILEVRGDRSRNVEDHRAVWAG